MQKIDKNLINNILKQAVKNPRHRQIYRFHKLKEPVQRMLNAVLPQSYVRPHYHAKSPEVFIVLQGKIVILKFNRKGRIINQYILNEKQGIEIKPKEYHCMIALKPTIVYEVKEGPYNKKTDKTFPVWAPEENAKEAINYLRNLKTQVSKSKIK